METPFFAFEFTMLFLMLRWVTLATMRESPEILPRDARKAPSVCLLMRYGILESRPLALPLENALREKDQIHHRT